MAKTLSPVCKLCRREGEKLYLKGERCFTPKCAFERRSFAPGQHGKTAGRGNPGSTGRASDFARQLRAKQKARRIYGVLERQFRRYYDTAITRLGFASSRAQARVLVTHGHFTVNGRRTDVPSMLLSDGDSIAVREGSGKLTYFKELGAFAEKRNSPSWLSRDLKSMSGSVARMPERAEIDGSLDEQLIVEYYSRR